MRAIASRWMSNSGNTILKKNSLSSPEAVLADTLIHHRSRYRYVGERGQEYRVVYSIFKELNTRTPLTNAHILWYSAIWYLVERSSAERMRIKAGTEPLTHLIDRLLTGDLQTQKEPQAIQAVDRFICMIVHLGILICRGEEIDRRYWSEKLARLTELLGEISTTLRPLRNNDAVYALSMYAACENLKKLMAAADCKIQGTLLRQLETHAYQSNIASMAGKIQQKGKDPYFHIEDFWNGIVP